MFLSCEKTATFDLYPGERTIFLISTNFSNTSGISKANKASKNSEETRSKISWLSPCGSKSTSFNNALTVYPTANLSPGIEREYGKNA